MVASLHPLAERAPGFPQQGPHQLPLAVVSDVEDLAPLGAVPAAIPLGDGGRVDNLHLVFGIGFACYDARYFYRFRTYVYPRDRPIV